MCSKEVFACSCVQFCGFESIRIVNQEKKRGENDRSYSVSHPCHAVLSKLWDRVASLKEELNAGDQRLAWHYTAFGWCLYVSISTTASDLVKPY